MNQQTLIELGAESALVSLKIAAPALLTIMITGFLVSLFQAATQISEQTLSFIPKIIAMTAALFFTGPWILQTMMDFTLRIFHSIAKVTH